MLTRMPSSKPKPAPTAIAPRCSSSQRPDPAEPEHRGSLFQTYTRGASQAPVSAIALILLFLAASALLGVGVLWQRERRRADRLEDELARERARPQGRALTQLPPLKSVLQRAARVRQEGLERGVVELLRGPRWAGPRRRSPSFASWRRVTAP